MIANNGIINANGTCYWDHENANDCYAVYNNKGINYTDGGDDDDDMMVMTMMMMTVIMIMLIIHLLLLLS